MGYKFWDTITDSGSAGQLFWGMTILLDLQLTTKLRMTRPGKKEDRWKWGSFGTLKRSSVSKINTRMFSQALGEDRVPKDYSKAIAFFDHICNSPLLRVQANALYSIHNGETKQSSVKKLLLTDELTRKQLCEQALNTIESTTGMKELLKQNQHSLDLTKGELWKQQGLLLLPVAEETWESYQLVVKKILQALEEHNKEETSETSILGKQSQQKLDESNVSSKRSERSESDMEEGEEVKSPEAGNDYLRSLLSTPPLSDHQLARMEQMAFMGDVENQLEGKIWKQSGKNNQ